MLLELCCLKEQFCVLRMKDLEQKDGQAQWSTVRHMLSIKKPAINTRNTAPEQHDSSPGGGGGSPEQRGGQEGTEKEWKKEKWGSRGQREKERLEKIGVTKEMKMGGNHRVKEWKGGRGSRRCWGTGAKLRVVAKKPNPNSPLFHLLLPRVLFSAQTAS